MIGSEWYILDTPQNVSSSLTNFKYLLSRN